MSKTIDSLILILSIITLISPSHIVPLTLKSNKQVPYLNLHNIIPTCPNFQLIFDTGSTDLWIADKICEGCPKRSLDCIHALNPHNLQQKEIHYASGWVKGYFVQYQLCGAPTRILCVTKAKDISHFQSDGVLGTGGNDSGRQFLKQLFPPASKQKLISIIYTRYNKIMVFGKLQTYLSAQNNIYRQQFQIKANQDWAFQIQKLSLDEQIISDRVGVIIDSGSTLIALPLSMFQSLIKITERLLNTSCSISERGVSCFCSDSYDLKRIPSIKIFVSSINSQIVELNLPSQKYAYFKERKCNLLITNVAHIGNRVVLGAPFLKQFSVTLNFENREVSIFQIDHQQLNRSEDSNIMILMLIVVLMVGVLSRVLIWIWHELDRPNKLII